MKLAGTIAVAGAVGVFAGATRGDDVSWRSPGAQPPAETRAAADPGSPAPPVVTPKWKPKPGDETSWIPVQGQTPPPAIAGPPAVLPARLPEMTRLPDLSPLPDPIRIPDQPRSPAPTRVSAPVSTRLPDPTFLVQVPVVAVPVQAVPVQPVPPVQPLPPPVVVPKPMAPTPAKGEPTQRPTKGDSVPLPQPRSAPGKADPAKTLPPPNLSYPVPTAAAAVVPASASVWGGYLPPDCPPQPAAADGAVPVRHGTFGSPDLRLSRDYHFLDSLVRPLTGEPEEKMILRDTGGTADRFYVQTEYLFWAINKPQIPVLATTASNQLAGFVGQPGTTELLGPGSFGPQWLNGFRVRAGGWFGDADCCGCGVDGSFFFLGRGNSQRSFSSAQYPTILRPIFAPNFNAEFGELVAFPGLATGTLDVRQTSSLWGADVNLTKGLYCGCDRRLWGFAGFRYLNLHEDLTIRETLTAGPNAPDPAGTQIVVQDRFDVRNQFYGGQVGMGAFRRWGRVSLDGRASVALGDTHQTLDINGYQVRTPPGGQPQVFTGGLLAAGPNLGQFTRDRFSVVPEVTLNVGYFLTQNVRVYAGYNFLYWSNVIRPGDQIDRVVDLTFVPNAPQVAFSGQNRPQPTFRQTDFWAQGIQFGVELRW